MSMENINSDELKEKQDRIPLSDDELENIAGGAHKKSNGRSPRQGVTWVCNKCKEERTTYNGIQPPKVGCKYLVHVWSRVHN